jgi:hypothetical protein
MVSFLISAHLEQLGCPCRKSDPVWQILRWMCDLCRLIFGLVVDLFRSRAALEAEVLVVPVANLIRLAVDRESGNPVVG